MKKNLDYTNIFIILLVINMVIILSSNIITSKLILVMGFVFTAGDCLFPVSYIINDIIVEVYGYKKAKFSIVITFMANFLMILIFMTAIALPYPEYYNNQDSFVQILAVTPRLFIASIIAYLFGSLFNSKIMSKLKNSNKKRKLWFRTILSSIIGEAVDTIIFITIAFTGIITKSELINLIISVYLLKLFIEIILTPILIFFIKKIKKIEGVEI